jgi:predicted lipid-binding transport protein (Tim44 family)
VVSTIRFFGGIKEEQEGETQEFAELWHVVHAWDRPEGDWYVAGIQQV